MTDEPSLGEVLRRLEHVATQMGNLSVQMRDDRDETARTFVRQDVYASDSKASESRLKKIETDEETREKDAAAFRRQLLFLILGISIPAIGGLLLAVSNYLAAGGATP